MPIKLSDILTRDCKKCGETKSVDSFQGNRNTCKSCRNKAKRDSRKRKRLEHSLSDRLPQQQTNPERTNKVEVIESGNTAVATTVSTRIKTLDQLLKACQVDLNTYSIVSHSVNSWEQNSQQDGIVTLYQVKANLQRIKAVAVEFPEITPVRYNLPYVKSQYKINQSKYKTCLVVPDIHVGYLRNYQTGELTPMHDEKAIAVTLQLIELVKPDKVVLLGDALDLGEMSIKWQSTPDMQYTTQASINYLALLLGQIRQMLPGSEINYICGNHEARFEKAVLTNLTACYGLTEANKPDAYPVMSVPHLLGLDELGVTFHDGYPDGEVYLNPYIRCVHGTIVKQQGGETTKAILNSSMQTHTICGHIHRCEVAYKTFHTYEGIVTRFAASPGTLGRLDGVIPAHTKRNNWQQGVLLVNYHETKDYYSLEPISIHKGEAMFRGQLLTA